MRVDIEVKSELTLTPRMRQVCAMFDAPPSEKLSRRWTGDIPLDAKPWQIGLVVGPSGAGKSTIARQMFGEEVRPQWPTDRSVIDCFDSSLSVEDVTAACGAVGFNTIPAWLRPYGTLSNGERFRVDLARVLSEPHDGIRWIDEFTSVVDRQVAQIGSYAIAKYIRKRPEAQFVAVGCHFDVIDWLQPDWILEPATMTLTWRSLQRRPGVEVEIKRCSRSLWGLFAPYHYMSAELSTSATCFALYVAGRPVSFAGCLSLPVSRGGRSGEAIWRVSRVVTLPDWQGLGLAFALIDSLGAAYAGIGSRFRNYPAHPAFVRSSARSKVWRQHKQAGTHSAGNSAGNMGGRPCAVFEYVGPPMDERQARRLIARG
jgi:GNAT superfamily N-acetyltransferase